MNDQELESFEQELQRLRPATPPENLLARLAAADPSSNASPRPAPQGLSIRRSPWWQRLSWWTAPALGLAAVLAAVTFWEVHLLRVVDQPELPKPPQPALTADEVEINRELVAAFEAVARLPSGEPVRFRCREWIDEVVLKDSSQGVVIHRRAPRFETIPVRFETY